MKIVILGAGESGVGAALLASKKSYSVFVSDSGKIKENYQRELEEHNIPFESNKHTAAAILDADWVVKSPGIPDRAPIVRECLQKNIPVISEIEFAAKHTDAYLIGITGSNGKTTTTNLIHHLLCAAGLRAGMGGNVGTSFARLLTHDPLMDYYVLELSSFQLDHCISFRPNVAILLNITPDHLDRYENNFDLYVASKFRIIQNQQPDDLFIYNAQDENIITKLKYTDTPMQTVAVDDTFFDIKTINTRDELRWRSVFTADRRHRYSLSASPLKGPHNAFNAICALIAAEHLGIGNTLLQKGLESFVNAPHRLELVATINGVDYINDSKATNVDATYFALLSISQPVVWIAGGKDKGNDYSRLLPLVQQKVKAVICLGVDNEKLLRVFESLVPTIRETRTMQQAVTWAAELAQPGMAVLLSPACASFDLFEHYEDRGAQFKNQVQRLIINN